MRPKPSTVYTPGFYPDLPPVNAPNPAELTQPTRGLELGSGPEVSSEPGLELSCKQGQQGLGLW